MRLAVARSLLLPVLAALVGLVMLSAVGPAAAQAWVGPFPAGSGTEFSEPVTVETCFGTHGVPEPLSEYCGNPSQHGVGPWTCEPAAVECYVWYDGWGPPPALRSIADLGPGVPASGSEAGTLTDGQSLNALAYGLLVLLSGIGYIGGRLR